MVYAGESVLGRPMRLGARPGPAELVVTIGQDGALLSAVVTDGEGQTMPHAWVSLIPEHATSAADLSVSGMFGPVDQSGRLDPVVVAPGKYRVLGWKRKLDSTPESLERIWAARSRATEVTAGSGGTAGRSRSWRRRFTEAPKERLLRPLAIDVRTDPHSEASGREVELG